MSTTQPRDNKIFPEGTKFAIHQLNPSYTVRVAFCLVFFFIMEIFLAHYVYRFIISEVREDLKQNDFQSQIRAEVFREEVLKIFTHMGFKNDHKLEATPPQIAAASKKRRLANSDHNEMELLSSCQKIKDFCLQIPDGHGSPSRSKPIEYNNTLTNITNTTVLSPISSKRRHRVSRSPVTEVLPPIKYANVDLVIKWEIRPYGGISYQTENLTRTIDCVVHYIGKPTLQRTVNYEHGSWMTDSHPHARPDYLWATKENLSHELSEYRRVDTMIYSVWTAVYALKEPFTGTSQVVYNGFFFYHIKGTNRIMKYGLKDGSKKYLELPGDMNRRSKLYSGQHNYVDFCVDENGLWLIFAVDDSKNTAVMKVDYENMTPQYAWNISIEHQNVGEMFIVCGVLYALDSVTNEHNKIRIAFDLYKKVRMDINLNYKNEYRRTTTLSYNHKTEELYAWAEGDQMTYPVRYHDITYNYFPQDDLPPPTHQWVD